MARKKDGGRRHYSNGHRHEKQGQSNMESYFIGDDTFPSFSSQLAKLGLELRDIPGDGNCLFRALGDQLEGHTRNHIKYRHDTVAFMKEHRKDFEPFVEDEIPFDRHLRSLSMLGTYAGNDAIVAFAKRKKLNVVIHQLNSPLWTIEGTDQPNPTELHISFHNGDHYSSVRRLHDNTESPANISLKSNGICYPPTSSKMAPHTPLSSFASVQSFGQPPDTQSLGHTYNQHYLDDSAVCDFTGNDSDYDNVPSNHPDHARVNGSSFADMSSAPPDGMARAVRDQDSIVQQVMAATGNSDRLFVEDTLADCFYDATLATDMILSITANSNRLNSQPQISPASSLDDRLSNHSDQYTGQAGAKPKQPKLTSSDKKRLKKQDKKQRATDRQREKSLAKKEPAESPSTNGYHGDQRGDIAVDIGTLHL